MDSQKDLSRENAHLAVSSERISEITGEYEESDIPVPGYIVTQVQHPMNFLRPYRIFRLILRHHKEEGHCCGFQAIAYSR